LISPNRQVSKKTENADQVCATPKRKRAGGGKNRKGRKIEKNKNKRGESDDAVRGQTGGWKKVLKSYARRQLDKKAKSPSVRNKSPGKEEKRGDKDT